MNIFISTGEVSGDLQAAALAQALFRQADTHAHSLDIFGMGGTRMAEAGVSLVGQSTGVAAFGLQETIPMILPAFQLQRRVKQHLRANPPDLVILIDYEGFNLSLGEFCQRHLPTVPIVYYIAPQVWIYSPFPGRTRALVEFSDRILTIFPQAADYFQDQGADATWVGHPLVDRMALAPNRETARQVLGLTAEEMAIAILPASRPQELTLLLPYMFAAAQQVQAQIPQARFWIPLSSPQFKDAIQNAIAQYQLNAVLVETDALQVLPAMDLAITKCGTVTLELAILNVPQVVLYRLAPLTMWAARYIFRAKIPFIAPPNLLLNREIVPELIQEAASADNIAREALDLLQNPERQATLQQDYQQMRQTLGKPGVCDRAAQEIWKLLPIP